MNEMQFGRKFRQALDQRIRLRPQTLERLRAARERALMRQRVERAAALAWADNVIGRLGGFGGLSLRLLLPAAVLVAGLALVYGLQQSQRAAEAEEIDALLLTDDLPIDAYLDKGFEAWLKKRGSR